MGPAQTRFPDLSEPQVRRVPTPNAGFEHLGSSVTRLESDAELAHGLMHGSLDAFERFVDVYHAKLFQYTFTMCGHREDAEEVAQETLMKVFENLTQLREPEHLKAWVFRIARNARLMKRRKSIFAPRTEVSLDETTKTAEGDMTLEIADRSALPEDLVLDAELRQVLDSAIRELPDMSRAVVLLRDVEGLSTEQAASILDLNQDVIKTRLRRAHLALRQKLEQQILTANGARHI